MRTAIQALRRVFENPAYDSSPFPLPHFSLSLREDLKHNVLEKNLALLRLAVHSVRKKQEGLSTNLE